MDIVSLIKLLCLCFKNIFSTFSVLPLHLFYFALFWVFFGGGEVGGAVCEGVFVTFLHGACF